MKNNSPSTLRAILAYALAAIFLCYEMALQTSPSIMARNLMQDLNLNVVSLGLMASTYFYSYTCMQLFAGWLFDRYAARRLIGIAIIICASGAFIFGHTTMLYEGIIGRFLMGIGSAFAFIGVLVVATQWLPVRYFALLVGIAQLLAALGALGGELPLAAALQHVSWQVLMQLLATIGIILSIISFIVIPHESSTKVATVFPLTIYQSFYIILKKAQTWWLAGYAFLSWAPITIFAALWGVPFLSKAFTLSNTMAAGLIALIWIGLGLASPLLGWLSDALNERRYFLIGTAWVGAIASTLIIYCSHLPLGVLAILLFCFGVAASGQILTFAIAQDIHQSHVVGTAIGFNNMAVVAGGALLQPLTALLLQQHTHNKELHELIHYSMHDYQYALVSVPICFILAAIIAHFFIKNASHNRQ